VAAIIKHFINPGLSLLPEQMDSLQARIMLVAIGLQESRFEHRRQIRGPARGFWQFEQGGGVRGVLNHNSTQRLAHEVCEKLRIAPGDHTEVYTAITYNDALACVFARLLLWTVPRPLPRIGEFDTAWDYYIEAWRPGKPHRHTWNNLYLQAVEEVVNGQ